MGAYSLGETRRVDPNAMVIKVTAIQWAWKFEYPDYGVTSKELYLPNDKQVLLKMESPDVIHSFWVPEFRVKQDVVPGRVTEYRITPTLEGSYKVRCSELCGTSHAYMESPVVVVSQAKFDAWILQKQAEAAAAQTPEGRGQLLVANNGCAACHSIDGTTMPGPTWQALAGSSVKLADGSTVTADDAYLIESIKNPTAKVVEGFNPIMPQYPFTDAEIADLVAYIKTLK
jgi:cytochrome c oxidase subunit 2